MRLRPGPYHILAGGETPRQGYMQSPGKSHGLTGVEQSLASMREGTRVPMHESTPGCSRDHLVFLLLPPLQTLVQPSSWNVGREVEHVRYDRERACSCVLPWLCLPLDAVGQVSPAVSSVGICSVSAGLHKSPPSALLFFFYQEEPGAVESAACNSSSWCGGAGLVETGGS